MHSFGSLLPSIPIGHHILGGPLDDIHCPYRADECKFSDSQQTLVCPYIKVHRKNSFMNLSLLLQQGPACFPYLTWIICKMGSKWPYNSCFLECCFQDLLKTTCSILVSFSSCFFSKCFNIVKELQPYCSSNTATARKSSNFISKIRVLYGRELVKSNSYFIYAYIDITFSR